MIELSNSQKWKVAECAARIFNAVYSTSEGVSAEHLYKAEDLTNLEIISVGAAYELLLLTDWDAHEAIQEIYTGYKEYEAQKTPIRNKNV